MNKSVYVASRRYQFFRQYAMILVWKTWSSTLNQLIHRDTGTLTVRILISLNRTLLSAVYRNDWLTFTSDYFCAIQSMLRMNMKSPIRKVLVLINQLFSGYFWFTLLANFSTELKKLIYDMKYTNRGYSEFCGFSQWSSGDLWYQKGNARFLEFMFHITWINFHELARMNWCLWARKE